LRGARGGKWVRGSKPRLLALAAPIAALLPAAALSQSGPGRQTTARSAPARTSTAAIRVLEPNAAIAIRAELPADGRLVRSFRLGLTGATPVTPEFLPSDLTSGGEKVDRSGIQVLEPRPLAGERQDYRLQIEGLTRPGTYTGNLDVSPTETKGQGQTISLTVVLIARQPIALSAETPKLALRLAANCDPFTRLVLGRSACPGTFRLNLVGTPRLSAGPAVSLLLAGSEGAVRKVADADAAFPSASFADGQLVLSVPGGSLAPDGYKGAIRAAFDGGATVVDAPIDLDVRWPAWIPLALIVLGVLGGRYQAYMSSTGTALGAAYDRLARLGLRAAALPSPSGDALGAALGPAARLVDARQPKEAADLLAKLEQCAAALERLEALTSLGRPFTTEQAATADRLVARARLGDGPECAKLADELAAALLPSNSPTGGAAGAGKPAANAPTPGRLSLLTRAVVESRWAAWLVLVVLIGLSGLYTLYVANGPRMGASPMADAVTLLAWGFTSDVAGRTLANFKGS